MKTSVCIKVLFVLIFTTSCPILAQWVQTNGPYGGSVVRSFAVLGTNLFAGTFGGVFLSTDNGASWTAVNNGLPPYTDVNSLAVLGTNLFAGTRGSGVWRRQLSEMK